MCLNDEGSLSSATCSSDVGKLDLLPSICWCDGQDLRYAPLAERKHKLRSILPKDSDHILYCDHVEHDGESLFRLACENETLRASLPNGSLILPCRIRKSWLKIRNTNYSQWEGREDLFLNESGTAILTFHCGTIVPGLMRKPNS